MPNKMVSVSKNVNNFKSETMHLYQVILFMPLAYDLDELGITVQKCFPFIFYEKEM